MIGGVIVDEQGQTRVLIHFAYRSHGKVVTACGGSAGQFTSERAPVNCPICKLTEAFRKGS